MYEKNKNLLLVKNKEGDYWFNRNIKSSEIEKKIYNKEYFKIIDLIKTSKINPKNILEIGCGTGDKLDFIRKELKIPKNCIGIDLSKKAIKYGTKKFKELKLYRMSSLDIYKIKKKFDLVICGFFLCLLDRHNIFKQFNLIYEKINYNGFLLIQDFEPLFNHTNFDNRNKNKLKIFKQSYTDFLVSSGTFKLIYKFNCCMTKKDKRNFLSNDYSMSLYQKINFTENYPKNI
jgi:ubiquinone/menaquinone biosynthesis C-methylase UbiE